MSVPVDSDVLDKTTLEPAYNLSYVGPAHPEWDTATLNEIDKNHGYVLYVNNIEVVTRVAGQEEDLKIAITF